MDPAEVGRTLKKAYPEYADMTDEQVGIKYLTKYGDKGLQALGMSTKTSEESQAQLDKDAATLRKEYNGLEETKAFKEIQKQWNNMQSAGEGGAGDISIMYSYIKMLDPTTAVREGELGLAAKAAGLPDRFVKAANQLDKGAGLGPDMRKQMIAEGGSIYNNVATNQKAKASEYEGYARDSRLDPANVVGNTEIKLADVPKVEEKGQSLKDRSYLEKLLSLEGTQQFFKEVPKTAAVGVGKTGQNVLDLLKGDISSIQQRNQEFQPEIDRSKELFDAAQGEVGAKVEALSGGQLVKGGIKSLLGLKGNLVNARNVASEGIDFSREALKKSANEALRKSPWAKKEYDDVVKAIDSAKDASELFDLKSQFRRFSTSAGNTLKGSKAAQFYKNLQTDVGEEISKVAPEAANIQNTLRMTYEAPKAAGKATLQALKASALGRLLGF